MVSIDLFAAKAVRKRRLVPSDWQGTIDAVKRIQSMNLDNLTVSEDGTSSPSGLSDLLSINFYSLYQQTEFKSVDYRHTKQDIVLDIKAIKKDVKSINLEGLEFSIVMPDVKMLDPFNDVEVNFGTFDVLFTESYAYVREYGGGDNNYNASGYWHPYVSLDNDLCLGENLEPYRAAFFQCRFLDAYRLVKQVLTTYGGDGNLGRDTGARRSLAEWTGVRCGICDALFPPQDGTTCSKTQMPICHVCYKEKENIDENTGLIYMPQFLDTCKECNTQTIDVRKGTCVKCRISQRKVNS